MASPALDPASLRFSSALEAQRYRELRRALDRPGWRHLPLEAAGNFLTERWCSESVDERACRSGAVLRSRTRGEAWARLATLHYPAQFPDVFGLVLDVGSMPAEGPWGAAVHLSLDGRTITGTQASITLVPLDGGEEIQLGDVVSWQVGETRFSVSAPGDDPDLRALEWLRALLSSPERFRTEAEGQLSVLQDEVVRGLQAGKARRCEYGEYKGDGIPPACTLVALTAEETAAELARVEATLKQQRDAVVTDADLLHALLVDLVPAVLRE